MHYYILEKLSELFIKMDFGYNRISRKIDFSCTHCQDTCCKSFFIHHTYVEWAFLKSGLEQIPEKQKNQFIERANHYIEKSKPALLQGKSPKIICPLNDNELCSLYQFRPMICRLHGVPSRLSRPDGTYFDSPGCFRFEEMNTTLKKDAFLERTEFYKTLALLEKELIEATGLPWPRIKMTIAEMIVSPIPF